MALAGMSQVLEDNTPNQLPAIELLLLPLVTSYTVYLCKVV